ncbi:SAM-dependent methyltransferase [Hominisplanchenecus murintestinalis]|uniref:SAM-dependent methyltransferase n=1 Tax=Hominisplanchenecus murintestinalis TaxID=2941517 RepID=UPI00203D00E6|nr:class I SAM-dependent methyltransferase [Hominisplanchenecus murintestinalis]
MAKLNLEYYSGENHYSDGDIEDEILKIAKEGKKLSELGQVEFPILYHLSEVRENILNWYPFRKDGTCLEIGSGCGALTGLLCERVRKVTSVELSKRRADINFARNHEKENLEIMVGNQNDMVFPEKFDYIVLNGVFEYAMSFTAGEKPYKDFLSYIAGFLKEDGILLIAIENRLGLKYFAGAPEDHTNAYMDGLKGYPGNESVRTFSKSEWVELMYTCGLKHYKFYYPYPDYKFPCEVFTDETLVSQKYGRKNWNFTENRFELFPEQEMAETFRKEGVMDRFANSFLIEMSKRPIQRETEVLYAKMNRDRADAFAIATKIERAGGRMRVTKSALTEQAKAHLERMHGNEERKESSLKLLEGAYQPGNLTYPYLTGNSLGYEANMAIQNRQPGHVKKLVREVYDFCVTDRTEVSEKETEAFSAVFGSRKGAGDYTYVCPANIDLILDNIFRDGGSVSVIDGEWTFDFPVPAEFIIWRTINEIYTNAAWFEEQLPRKEFLKEYGIEEEDAELFHAWAEHFEKEYVKANRLADYAVPEVGVNLEEIRRRRIQEVWMDSTLYVDTGNGFSEEETVKVKTKLADGKLELTLRLPQGKKIRALRFDPLEGRPCVCELCADGACLTPVNAAEQRDRRAVFLTTDPAYRVEITGDLPQVLKISGAVEVKDKDWALQEYQRRGGNTGRRWKFWK